MKDQNIKKVSTLYQCTGRSFTYSTQKQRQLLRPLNNLEKADPSEIEITYNIIHHQYPFRINGKCNNSHAPSIGLSGILLSASEPNIPYEKVSTLYRCTRRSYTNSTQKQQQLLRLLNNLKKWTKLSKLTHM